MIAKTQLSATKFTGCSADIHINELLKACMEVMVGSRQGEGLFVKVFCFPNSHDGDSDMVRMFFYGTLKILMATS